MQKEREMISISWMKCGSDGHYCDLEQLDLASLPARNGVYVIWHQGNPSRVVRIGQGDIADRLAAHRRDPQVVAFKQYGKLRVTWAAVPAHQIDGVERYLADTWSPLIGDAFPMWLLSR